LSNRLQIITFELLDLLSNALLKSKSIHPIDFMLMSDVWKVCQRLEPCDHYQMVIFK